MLTILDLPEDIIIKLIDILPDASPFVLTCKYIKTIGDSYGYIKHLYVKEGDDLKSFHNKMEKHHRMIRSVIIDGISNTEDWLPFYPKKILFNITTTPIISGTLLEYKFNPSYTTTEELFIIASRNIPCIVLVNWEKFTCLRKLYLNAFNVDLEGIDKLQKLEYVTIDFGQGKNINSHIPYNLISTLPNIKCISINATIQEDEYYKLKQKGVEINFSPRYTPDYREFYMYLIIGKYKNDIK
jgi:hypothetical protein